MTSRALELERHGREQERLGRIAAEQEAAELRAQLEKLKRTRRNS